MNRRIVTALAAALLGLAACDSGSEDPMTSGEGSSGGDETGDPTGVATSVDPSGNPTDPTGTSSDPTGDTDDPTGDTDDPTGDTDDPTGDPIGGECDPFAQDCPEGEKCMPYADDGGNAWNANRCVPVVEGAGQPGDPCVVEGSGVSGVDNCDLGSMCYYVSAETNEGICTPLCGGNPASPTCDDGYACSIYNDGILPLCLEECDPLAQDCSGTEQLCVASPANDGFVCLIDALPNDAGVYGAPCSFANACDPGLFCASQAIVPGCTNGGGCCSEFCNLDAATPDAECSGSGDGQTCQPWWNGDPAPPGYETVGFCGIPQ